MPENRHSFFARIDFMSPTELALICDAYDLAKATHKNQFRKEIGPDGTPKRYFEHVREAAIIAIDELGITDPSVIALILMHDVLEDAEPAADVTPEKIERRFDPLMTRRLLLLSKKRVPKNALMLEKEGLRAEYVYRLHHFADLTVLLAKGLDRLHNLRTLCCNGTTTDFIQKQCRETRSDYVPLFAKMEEVARGTVFHAAALQLRILIHEELVRCEMRLARKRRGPILGTPAPIEDDNAFSGDHGVVVEKPSEGPSVSDGGAVCADHAARLDRG